MNKFTRAVIAEFGGAKNKAYLTDTLVGMFRCDSAYRIINSGLNDFMANFITAYERTVMTSDPIMGMPISQYVAGLNHQFLTDVGKFIYEQIAPESATQYTIRDGSRPLASERKESTGDMLNAWKANSSRAQCVREDLQGGADDGGYELNVCDQKDILTSQHVDWPVRQRHSGFR